MSIESGPKSLPFDGRTFVIYTTQEGGLFKVTVASREQYDEAVTTGQWDETPYDSDQPRGIDMVTLSMIALLRVEDNHDFVLGGSRDKPETWKSKHRPRDLVA